MTVFVGLAGLAAGWMGAVGLGARGVVARVLLSLPLGLGLWLTWTFLLAQVVSPRPAGLLGAVFAVAFAAWLARGPVCRVSLSLGWPFWLLSVLASVAAWLSTVGGCQLSPPRDFLLFELPFVAAGASGPHPLGPEALAGVTPFAAATAILGGDPFRCALVLGGLAQVAVVLGWLLLLLRWSRSGSLAMALAGLSLFMGSADGWLVSDLPSAGAAHLLAVVALWLWSREPLLAVPPLLALLTLSPHLALALSAALLLPLPRHFLMAGLLLAIGLWQAGLTLGLLAALYLWWTHPKKYVRVLAAAEFFLPGVFGLTALGLALGRTARALWLRYPGERLELRRQPDLALRVPRRLLLGLCVPLALWLAMAPGEEAFNDRVLIYSQKQKVKVEQLLIPRRLEEWALWRGTSVGFAPADLEAARALPTLEGPALYLTGEPEEKVEVAALVSSLAGGRPLAGWYVGRDGAGLLPAAAAVASTGRDHLLGATPVRWLLRRGAQPVALRGGLKVAGSVQGKPLRSERWAMLQWFEVEQPGSYQVTRDGRPFGAEFGVALAEPGEIPFQLPGLPGKYEVRWPSDAGDAYAVPAQLPLQATLGVTANVPCRSLLAQEVTLTNTSGVRLDLSDLAGARLSLHSLTGKPDKPAPVTRQAGLILGPGESRGMKVHLRTPLDPDILEVRLELLDSRGTAHSVPSLAPPLLRAWTRRPPFMVPDGVVTGQ